MQHSADAFGLPDADSVSAGEVHLVAATAVAGVAIPPNENGYPAGPGIIFAFRYRCPTHRRYETAKFLVANDGTNEAGPAGDGIRAFAELIVAAARVAVDEYEPGAEKALDAMAAELARRDPQLAPRCPGCGARLFAAVAERGACLACFPTAPPDDVLDQAAPLNPGEPA